MPPAFKYSAFISYSSKDKPWATRLEQDLSKQLGGSPIYLDQERLEEGKEWNRQLEGALRESEHLIVFYSSSATASDWVKHEMSLFNAFAGSQFGKQRRLLCVLTDSAGPTVYPHIQHFKDLVGTGIHDDKRLPTDMSAAQAQVWEGLLVKVATRMRSNAELIPVALVTLTGADAQELDWNKGDPGERRAGTLGEHASKLGITSAEQFTAQYGETRQEWRPFGSKASIKSVLGQVIGALNALTKPQTYDWDFVDFLSPQDTHWKEDIARLAGGSVILIDPLSLYHGRVSNRFQLLRDSFEQGNVLFLSLTPFEMMPAYYLLRELVRDLSAPLLQPYFEPVLRRMAIATCAVNISDELDLQRAVLSALLRGAAEPAPKDVPQLAGPERGF